MNKKGVEIPQYILIRVILPLILLIVVFVIIWYVKSQLSIDFGFIR